MSEITIPPAEQWRPRRNQMIDVGPYVATITVMCRPSNDEDWATRAPTAFRDHIIAAVREREAQAAEIERLRAALKECAAPHLLGNEAGIDWEGLAREFSRRQQVAAKAIGRLTGAELSPEPEPTP